MKFITFPLIALCLLVLAGPTHVAAQNATVFTVNTNADTVDAVPGDRICADSSGNCTLRAAVEEANSNAAGGDIIIFALPVPSVIDLTRGPLRITGARTAIVGPGARRLAVQRSFAPDTTSFGIFHVPNNGTNVTIRGLTIKNGNAGTLLSGGGIRIGSGVTAQVTEVSIVGNSGGSGGGIANEGNLTLNRSLLASNLSNFQGGAIHSSAGSSARITNSTITENTAPTGGAIWNGGTMLLVNDTITNNAATNAARSIFSDPSGSINVLNTIIGSDNASTSNSLSGAFTSLGNNIVTDARTSTGFTNGVNNDQVSDNNVINPLLGNLADNGGHTDTRALLNGSPAINAGNSCVWNATCTLPPGPTLRLFWDQRRGHLRGGIFDAVDIGAFEFGGSSGSGSGFLVGSLFPSPTARYLNSNVVFTNVATNEKTYRVVNAAGRFRSPNLANEVHIQEIRNKRAPAIPPAVLAFPD